MAGFAKANALFGPADKVLLAISGGADSTALLYAACTLKAEGVLSNDFVCAHINHQLRGDESNADEDFVIAQAHSLNLAITTKQVDVRGYAHKNKLSIETAARKLRIESLLDTAKTNNCNAIATAHQKNDNAETIIQRLTRGTGLRGLGGIWPMRRFADDVRFVRPLLCVSRDEITEYLNERNLNWRVDRTNYDYSYRRNYIRHRLIPALQADCNDSLVEQLSRLSQSAQRFYSLVRSCADKLWPELADYSSNELKLDLNKFSSQPEPVKVELIRRSLARLGSGERNLTQQHYERILQLAQQKTSGKKIELPGRFAVRREYGNLIFVQLKENKQFEEKTGKKIHLKVPGKTKFGQYLMEATVLTSVSTEKLKTQNSKFKTIEWFDLDKVKLPLTVRFRQVGDRFWPLGLAGEKRVGKFLTAAKVPQEIRRKLLIVTDSEKIIWLWPIRISEQAKVSEQTKRILQLKINET